MTEAETTPVVENNQESTPAPAEEPVKEEVKAEGDAPAQQKSFFAKICGCFGGSNPPADTDDKDAPTKKDVETEEVEKEEVGEDKPIEVAAPETASA